MVFGGTGEHGQGAARVVLEVKRFVLENVIIPPQIMMAKHVLESNRRVVLAIRSPVQVANVFSTLICTQPLRY